MAAYKKEAERMQLLRRLPEQSSVGQGLHLKGREQLQAENHRPPQLVHSLVQRHFFPAEGAVLDGVGEQLLVDKNSIGTEDKRLSEYNRLVRRRAAATSKAIKADQNAKLMLAEAARSRLQAAKDYGVFWSSVAPHIQAQAGRHEVSKVSEPRAAKSVNVEELGNGEAATPGEVAQMGALSPVAATKVAPPKGVGRLKDPSVAPAPPARPAVKQHSKPCKGKLEMKNGEPELVEAAISQPHSEHGPQVCMALITKAQSPDAAAVAGSTPPASRTARQRLLLHCTSVDASAVSPQGLGAALWPGECRSAPMVRQPDALDPPPQAMKARVLQQLNTANSAPTAKLYKGRPLPLVVSVRDEAGLARIAQRAAALGDKLVLPRLCACPNNSSPFDPHYVQTCARNCPLYMQPARYESLLTSMLRAADVI